MRNTLVDSNLGDVESINMPVGQSTPFAGNFTTVGATVGAFQSVSVSQPVTIAGNAPLAAVAPSINLTATTDTFAAAVAVTAVRNIVVSASFTSGSPLALPSVATWLGSGIQVFNQTTQTVAVWPQPHDIIDTNVTGTAVLLDAGKRSDFYAVSTTGIISAQLGVTSV